MTNNKMQIFRPTTSKSGVFLLELILVILFFSIASTVCIEMFVKSYTISNDSRYLNKSVQIAEVLAETFKADDNIVAIPYTETYYFNEDISPGDDTSYFYTAFVSYDSNDGINTAVIDIYVDKENYFSLTVNHYIPQDTSGTIASTPAGKIGGSYEK